MRLSNRAHLFVFVLPPLGLPFQAHKAGDDAGNVGVVEHSAELFGTRSVGVEWGHTTRVATSREGVVYGVFVGAEIAIGVDNRQTSRLVVSTYNDERIFMSISKVECNLYGLVEVRYFGHHAFEIVAVGLSVDLRALPSSKSRSHNVAAPPPPTLAVETYIPDVPYVSEITR